MILALVDEALAAGARLERACAVIGVCARSVARWQADRDGHDRRRGPDRAPAHKLSAEERAEVLATANQPEYRSLSPRQIVPRLADQGRYLASESTFYRVLHEAGQMAHRGGARPAQQRPRRTHVATGPNQVWSWDITYLRSQVRGSFYYLYLIVDVWSRKIMGASVRLEESQVYASDFVAQAVAREAVPSGQLVVHSDNGGPMKGATLLATLQRLGVATSFSRPSVSDDNAFSESLFRTLKYRPGFPRRPFADLAEALRWVEDFVAWYNHEHLHSGIRFVTPATRHARQDVALLARRRVVYASARKRTPARWTGPTRNWTPVGAVYLNPLKQEVRFPPIAKPLS